MSGEKKLNVFLSEAAEDLNYFLVFETKMDGESIGFSKTWNAALKLMDKKLTELAKAEGQDYHFVEGKSNKADKYHHADGYRIWRAKDGTTRRFDIAMAKSSQSVVALRKTAKTPAAPKKVNIKWREEWIPTSIPYRTEKAIVGEVRGYKITIRSYRNATMFDFAIDEVDSSGKPISRIDVGNPNASYRTVAIAKKKATEFIENLLLAHSQARKAPEPKPAEDSSPRLKKLSAIDPDNMTGPQIDKEYANLKALDSVLTSRFIGRGWGHMRHSDFYGAQFMRDHGDDVDVKNYKLIYDRLTQLKATFAKRYGPDGIIGVHKTPTPKGLSARLKAEKAPKPILKGDRTSLNIKVQTFNGVKMTPKQFKTFKAQAQSMDVPVIVAAHNGAIVQMNHEPEGAVDYAIIYPLGRFVPSHAHADPRTGFLPSHADEYHQRSAGHDEHARPAVESHGAPKPDNVPGMILRKDEPLTDWLNQKFDSQMHSPAVHGLQRAVYDAASRLYFYTSKFGIKPVFITDQFNLVSATSAKEVFLTQKQTFGNPASQASKGLMWCVTFEPNPITFAVYEYIPKEHLEPLELLKELGLGYKPDEARLAHPMLTDLITQEPLGRMTIAQAAEFAKHYVRRPRMDNKSFSFTPLQWKTLYSAVAHAQSQDKNRHNLVGIMLRPGRRGKDEVEAVAVNGAVLSIAHIQGNPLPHSIFIPTPAVKLMNAAYRDKQVPSLIFRNEELHQKSDSLNFGGTLTVDVAGQRTPFVVSVSFPDYERAADFTVSKDPAVRVSTDTKKLLAVLKEFSLDKAEKHPRIVLTFHEATKTLEIMREYYNAQGVQMHVTKSVDITINSWMLSKTEAKIALNPIYLMDVMKSMKSKQTSFIFEDKGQGIRIADYSDIRSNSHNHEHLIMALRM